MKSNIAVLLFIFIVFASFPAVVSSQTEKVPGIVIDHKPASEKIYIGSPSIAILPDGSYVASHDQFGTGSTEHERAVTEVFSSSDKGKTWIKISEINGQFWSNLFVHRDTLYIMGTWKHHGNLIIRQSADGGKTWTDPADRKQGLIREGEYHSAPMPMLYHNGRIWRALEYAGTGTEWGKRYSAMVFSAPENSNLLLASNWSNSNYLTHDTTFLDGRFRGWLEGNAVVTPTGELIDILRVATTEKGRDLAAIVRIGDEGKTASFDKATGFFDFSGGARKFSIRYDRRSGRYWTICNLLTKGFEDLDAGSVRNTLVIKSSEDLKKWSIHKVLLQHPDQKKHGFQYIDWQFDGKDIIFVSRTAYDDGFGGANNYHDANYLTFHRISNFRKLVKTGI